MLMPRSSKALCHLGEVLYLLNDLSPSLVTFSEIEKLFRSSLELEGGDMNSGEPSKYLFECEFWKNQRKKEENTPMQSPTKTATPVSKTAQTVGRGRGQSTRMRL